MADVILYIDDSCEWTPLRWIEAKGGSVRNGMGTLEIGSHWLSVVLDPSVLVDVEPTEWNLISSKISAPIPYFVETDSDSLLELLIESVPEEARVLLDNDCGLIVEVRELRGHPVREWIYTSKER